MKTDKERLEEIFIEGLFGKTESAYLADYLISKGVTIPVRCGECKYYSKEPHSCKCELHSKMPDQYGEGFDMQMIDVDFCSYGERREK